MKIEPTNVDVKHTERILAELLKTARKGSTKQQYALLLKKFINYVHIGNSDTNCKAADLNPVLLVYQPSHNVK